MPRGLDTVVPISSDRSEYRRNTNNNSAGNTRTKPDDDGYRKSG